MAPRKAPVAKKTTGRARTGVSTRGKTVAEAAKAADDVKAGKVVDPSAGTLAGIPAAAEPKVAENSAVARAASEELEAAVRSAEEKGYYGETFDPHPNEAYSLQSGPDGPPVNPPQK